MIRQWLSALKFFKELPIGVSPFEARQNLLAGQPWKAVWDSEDDSAEKCRTHGLNPSSASPKSTSRKSARIESER